MEYLSPGLSSDVAERQLLQSTVEIARQVYGAAASSVFMVCRDSGELVFAAVTGAGGQSLVGERFEAGTGIAGWVAASGQTIVEDNVGESDRFALDTAASIGYLPTSIMAAPLVADGRCVGVLEVLDRHAAGSTEPSRELEDLLLLGMLATHAALSLSLLWRRQLDARTSVGVGSLLGRLSEHAAMDSYDPLAVALLGVSLDLLDRATPTASISG